MFFDAASLLPSLRGAFRGRLLERPDEMTSFVRDYRQRWGGPALAVALPDSTDDVAAVVRWCAAHGVAIVPQGGNTGLTGASVPAGIVGGAIAGHHGVSAPASPNPTAPTASAEPSATEAGAGPQPDRDRPVIVLSLKRLQRVRSVDLAGSTMVVEAGCTLAAAQAAAAAHGRLFPLSLASEGSCTVGGNLATNAGGVQVLRYGNMRELCLGLEVVTASGEVWHGLNRLRKNNTGYDLRDLFIGAEGTLGIITAAVLKLFPQPAGRVVALAQVDAPEQALTLLVQAQSRLAAELTAFELMSADALGLVHRHFPELPVPFGAAAGATPAGQDPGARHDADTGHDRARAGRQPVTRPWFVLLEASSLHSEAAAREGLETVLAAAMEAGTVRDAVLSGSLAQFAALWALRENISAAQSREGRNIKHDISVPIGRIAEFMVAAEAQLRAAYPAVRLTVFGHLGDGNLHFNVSPRAQFARQYDEAFAADEARVNHIVHDVVAAHEGAISAEHGIGVLRLAELARYKQPLELQMMRAIKAALDPDDRMNPGKLLPTYCKVMK